MFQKSLEKLSACPLCNSDEYVTLILMGRPINAAVEISRRTGFYKLGECIVTGDENNFLCRKCKKGF